MSGMVSFLIRKKCQSILEWPQIGKFLLFTVGAFLGGFTNGIGIGEMIDLVSTTPQVSVHQVLIVYTLIFGFLFFLLDLFPVPKQIGGQLPEYYPVEAIDKLKINVTFSLLRHFVFFVILMHFVLVVYSDSVTFTNGSVSFVVLLSFYLANRIFVNQLAFEIKNGFIITVISLALVSFSMVLYWINGFNDLVFLSCMLVFLALFVLFAFTEVTRRTKIVKVKKSYKSSLFLRLFSKKEVRQLLLIGGGFKALFLMMLAFPIIIKGDSENGFTFVLYFMSSPLILFSYLGFNFFGISRGLFFTHTLREQTHYGLRNVYTYFMCVIGVIDFILFLIVFYMMQLLTLKVVLFYITIYFTLLFLGLFLSLRTPVIRESYISMDFTKNKSIISIPAMITGMLTIGIAYGATYLNYYYFIDGLLILGASYFYFWHTYQINSISQRMLKKMKLVK
tara:strand:+ start:14969 stop:16312 length:1344 start_codon:yes stop_codon:yes gene_type:complete